MKGKYKIFYTLFCFIIILSLMGCSEKELPFINSPENNIKIDYMEDIVLNKDTYKEMYMDYASMRIVGFMSEDLEKFLTEMENVSTERVGKFVDNGDKFIIVQTVKEKNEEDIKEIFKNMIDNYLKGTMKKKPFEKEVVQKFYVGFDWSKGKDKENMKDVIEYIRDISE